MGGNKPRQPPVPSERPETLRQEIIFVLEGRTLSAKDISANVGIREREVCEHLGHIRKSLDRKGASLLVTPSECKKCGFVYKKRERFTKPSKCPICRGQSITEPLFSIR